MRILTSFLSLLLPVALLAQSPSEEWRTLETAHFAVHYPREYEEWTREVASRLESTRARVGERVGYLPNQRVDVIVADPQATANGSAWPVLGWPRIVLWTTPPEPESSIGSFRDWRDLLVTHEQAHILHLIRPPRNPLQRVVSHILPIGPVAEAPRWVSEGYATVIEGELTGSGRPFGAMRASLLRTWGRHGRLPSYERLASDGGSWLGMSMAYLVGSAYLEWLQERGGPDSLQKLWRRMTARESRNFDAAFRGVFGDSPRALYGRFVAEITAGALTEERASPETNAGDTWQDFPWSTDPPALSRDGAFLATVRRSRTKPAKLVVYSTGAATEEEERYAKRIARILERDPEDVAPVRPLPLPRKPVHERTFANGADPRDPRFSHDGKSIFFHQLDPDDEGVLHAELYRWQIADDRLERLTSRGDLREADPSPDGKSLVAVQSRFGKSSIVRFDLTTREVEVLVPGDVHTIHARPRWSRDGKRISAVQHRDGRWQPVVIDAASRSVKQLEMSGDVVAALAWSEDDRVLYTTLADAGHFDLAAIDSASGSTTRLTGSHDPVFAPEIDTTKKRIFFLALDPDGFDLRTLELNDLQTLRARTEAGRRHVREIAAGEALADSRAYGFGRQEILPIISGFTSRSSDTLEVGLRLGDVIGRINTVAIGSIGNESSLRGASLSTAIRRWPVELSAQLFHAEQSNSSRDYEAGEAPGASLFDRRDTGLEIRLSKAFRSRGRSAVIEAGALALERERGSSKENDLRPFIQSTIGWRPAIGALPLNIQTSVAAVAVDEELLLRLGALAEARVGGVILGLEGIAINAGNGVVSLGGIESSITPRSLDLDRMVDPAYALGSHFGSRAARVGASLRFTNGVRLFIREDQFRGHACCEARARSWGAEVVSSLDPFPLLRLPGIDLRAGVARVDDGQPWERTNYWIGTVIRP